MMTMTMTRRKIQKIQMIVCQILDICQNHTHLLSAEVLGLAIIKYLCHQIKLYLLL